MDGHAAASLGRLITQHNSLATGPDHLAALLPRCIGKRWYQAMRIGAVWGLGESSHEN